MTFLAQDALDYSNDAQYRVAADTRCLRKKTTIEVSAGVSEYEVPDDVIQVLAVYDDVTSIDGVSTDDALILLSGADNSATLGQMVVYNLEPRVIGFIPTPTEAFTATIFYIARPAPLDSSSSFELQGAFEALIEHMVLASRLDDDGQPELAQYEYAYYDAEKTRLHRLRLPQPRGRLPVIGYPGQGVRGA